MSRDRRISKVDSEVNNLFKIGAAAPNIDEMSRVRSAHKTRGLTWKFIKHPANLGLAVVAICLCVAADLALGTATETIVYFLFALLGLALIGWILFYLLEVKSHHEYVVTLFDKLNPDECVELAEMFEKTDCSEILDYRDSVIKQNREFCFAELCVIEEYLNAYNASISDEHKQTRLYKPDVYKAAVDKRVETGAKP